MSEFQKNPEELKAELKATELEIKKIEDTYTTEFPDGPIGDKNSGEYKRQHQMSVRKNALLQIAFEILITLNDIEGIERRLRDNIEATKEEYEMLEIPMYIDEVFQSTFGSVPGELSPEVEEVVKELRVEYGLLDDEEDED